MGSKKRALERRRAKERTVPGMAGVQQQGSLVSNEEDWGKEEENPHKGWYGNTGREFLDEAGPACQNLEACISPVWVANVCIKWLKTTISMSNSKKANYTIFKFSVMDECSRFFNPETQNETICWDSSICFQGITYRTNLTQAISCQWTNEESNISNPVELSANISLNLIIHGFLSVFLGFACHRELIMGYGALSLQIASRRLP